jgi:hypothetical protein
MKCETCENSIKAGRQIFVMSPRFDEPDRPRAFCSWGCLNIFACGPTDSYQAEREATS